MKGRINEALPTMDRRKEATRKLTPPHWLSSIVCALHRLPLGGFSGVERWGYSGDRRLETAEWLAHGHVGSFVRLTRTSSVHGEATVKLGQVRWMTGVDIYG